MNIMMWLDDVFMWNVTLKYYCFFEVIVVDNDSLVILIWWFGDESCWIWLVSYEVKVFLFGDASCWYDLWIMRWRCFFLVMTIWWMFGEKYYYVLVLMMTMIYVDEFLHAIGDDFDSVCMYWKCWCWLLTNCCWTYALIESYVHAFINVVSDVYIHIGND